MQCPEHSAAPAQHPPSALGRAHEGGAMLLPSDNNSHEEEAARSEDPTGSALKQAEAADRTQSLAKQQTGQIAEHKLRDGHGTVGSNAENDQWHIASARPESKDAAAQQQNEKDRGSLSQAAAMQQQDEGVAAMADHDLNLDDGLPLASLFASGHPGECTGQPAAQPRLQHGHARSSQPASQDSNRENRLPDAGRDVQRWAALSKSQSSSIVNRVWHFRYALHPSVQER